MAARVDRLAREEEHVATPRALALLLVGAALVVLAVNALAVRLSPASERTFDGMVVEKKWKLAGEGAPDGGVVVIGDSSGNFGVDAAVLSKAMGVPAINLCAYGRICHQFADVVTGSSKAKLMHSEAPWRFVATIFSWEVLHRSSSS